MNTDELSKKLTEKGAALTPSTFEHDVGTWFKTNGKRMATLAGSDAEARKILVAAITSVSKNPRLLECAFETFAACLMQSATLLLYPGAMRECSYVPLWNSKANRYEANFWPEYPGLMKLAYNSGFVREVVTAVVWECDEFDYQEGDTPRLKHRPNITCPQNMRGKRVGAYVVIDMSTGKKHRQFVSAETIEGIKNSSPGAKKSDSPWNSNNPDKVDWMWRKTALKQGLKLVPKSPQLTRALQQDDAIEIGNEEDVKEINFNSLINSIESESPKIAEVKSLDRPKTAIEGDITFSYEKESIDESTGEVVPQVAETINV